MYAISDGVDVRGPAFGMAAGRIDGNDVIAVFKAVKVSRGKIVAEHDVPARSPLDQRRLLAISPEGRTGHLDASGCRSYFPSEEVFAESQNY